MGTITHRFFLAAQFMLAALPAAAVDAPRVAHVFVALCDNATQGIAPVPAKIGDGNDPCRNLYWGCDDGLRSYFKRSRSWRLVQAAPLEGTDVLERLVFKHAVKNVWLVADAYRGSAIKRSLEDFLLAAAGARSEKLTLQVEGSQVGLSLAGGSAFLAYIGHNGLMDFSLPFAFNQRSAGEAVPAVVLCCKSREFFEQGLLQSGCQPLLLTTQFMYPGSFILHSALEGWLAGKPSAEIHEMAAAAYARNQRISLKAARGVFFHP